MKSAITDSSDYAFVVADNKEISSKIKNLVEVSDGENHKPEMGVAQGSMNFPGIRIGSGSRKNKPEIFSWIQISSIGCYT